MDKAHIITVVINIQTNSPIHIEGDDSNLLTYEVDFNSCIDILLQKGYKLLAYESNLLAKDIITYGFGKVVLYD